MTYRLALLDLDGTLTDSAPGILSSVRYAYEALGIAPPKPDVLRTFVGPPLTESLPRHGVPLERVQEAMAAYRTAFTAGGMFENSVYPGVVECLTALRDAGVRLAVATSKPEVFARQITAHFGLDDYVEGVFGASLDGTRSAKADVIDHALHELATGPHGVPCRDEIVMVGDREHDVRGAHAHGLATIGVTWGYAPSGELEAARPTAIVTTPAELARVVGGVVLGRVAVLG